MCLIYKTLNKALNECRQEKDGVLLRADLKDDTDLINRCLAPS